MIKLSKKAMMNYMKVLNIIKQHKIEKPIKSVVIENKLSLAGATVREIVHYLRVDFHEPIGSKNGYFYARTMSELQHTINDLRSRQRKIHNAEKGLCAAFPPQEQTAMFETEKKKVTNISPYDIGEYNE